MSETVRLRPWPRCKTCGNLMQVSTGRCVECDLPTLCFGCITAEYRREDPQPHPGGTTRYMGCECWCHDEPAPEIAAKESGR